MPINANIDSNSVNIMMYIFRQRMPDPELFDIFLAKAVRFWIKTIEVHNIKDEKHCDTILDYLQSQLNAIHSQNPYDKIQSQSEIDFVLAAGIRFWYDVVKK